MRREFYRFLLVATMAVFASPLVCTAIDVPVPARCSPEVNQRLTELLASGQSGTVDNVMVCGVTVSASRTQRGGPHGDHQILPLRVTTSTGEVRLVEVVTNDDLDGRVTAAPNTPVFAYGQAFFPSRGRFVAGIHDVHCATHRGADNGWVVVDGEKHPASCPR
ncbi:MAG TPA: hypothetical protein VM554_01395 [Acidisarcina sp.]|nr:hypothetical protein [Acidisarcina sp.]